MGITATRLEELGLIDRIIEEPLGGAHRDVDAMAGNLKSALLEELNQLSGVSLDELVENRYKRLMAYGQFTDR